LPVKFKHCTFPAVMVHTSVTL